MFAGPDETRKKLAVVLQALTTTVFDGVDKLLMHFAQQTFEMADFSRLFVAERIEQSFVFARRIHMASQIPVGVIDVSRGGTTVETWTPLSVLEQIDTEEVRGLLQRWDEKIAEWDPQQDSTERSPLESSQPCSEVRQLRLRGQLDQ